MGSNPLFDAHVHLPAYPEPQKAIDAARGMKMRVASATVSADEAEMNLRLREKNPEIVRSFLGIHPSEALRASGHLERLRPFWRVADGVGEIGLDPKYSEVSPKSPQMKLFTAQLEVAEHLKKPIQVHSRGAEEACLNVLGGRSLGSVLLHWFEGEDSLLRISSIGTGCFVSFGPAILYSKKLLRIAKKVPPEMVLTESDGPVAFAPLGGVEGSRMIPTVIFKLAEVWEKSFDEAVVQLSLNEKRYLQ